MQLGFATDQANGWRRETRPDHGRAKRPSGTYRAPSSCPIRRISIALLLYWKAESREMTMSSENRDSSGGNVLGNAVAEVVLLWVAAEVSERQHRNRGSIK